MGKLLILGLVFLIAAAPLAAAEPVELFVDEKTGQVFIENGVGRKSFGLFQRVEEVPKAKEGVKAAVAAEETAPSAIVPVKAWYERFSVRGYSQLRVHAMLEKDGADWYHPSDRSVRDDATFLLRRGRIALSGDATDSLFFYMQPDMSSKPGEGDFSVQLRDLYADYYLVKDRSFRVRFALNSGAEGERDNGVFLFFSPAQVQKRFSLLTKDGFKGTGDLGVAALGVYTGQGLNRADENSEMHTVARFAYPFEVASGQYLEANLAGYYGNYVPQTSAYLAGDTPVVPSFAANGVLDARAAAALVLHPNPFGFEVEWNVGRGPQLDKATGVIDDDALSGGYAQFNYRVKSSVGDLFPFVRYQFYEGGRKFAENSPQVEVREWDFGTEWDCDEQVELTVQYSFTPERTDSRDYPYDSLFDGHRVGAQVQFSY